MTKRSFTFTFFALALLMGGAANSAPVGDLTCTEGGCLKSGWVAHHYPSGGQMTAQCNFGDCATKGWVQQQTRPRSNAKLEATCLSGECFKVGWLLVDPLTNQVNARVECFDNSKGERDCYSGGWVVRERNRGSYWVECLANDCRQRGWRVFLPNGQVQTVACKPGGCIEEGWLVYEP